MTLDPIAHHTTVSGKYGEFDAGVVNWLRQDDQVVSGFWRCTPEEQPDVYEATFATNETVYIIEGRVEVEVVGGPVLDLAAGDSASFVKGTVGRWRVIEPVLEFFVYS
ncbi:cupin domain-containing protein [Mycobacterium kyogaense]|uniref:cupin domain-containing protein n=1 Tax=Mycobacterium kyogaense TaxID=2212479 RepID=UPI000DAF2C36|nr:cupin domain-containing protein [Mycobacterium kyogaense]